MKRNQNKRIDFLLGITLHKYLVLCFIALLGIYVCKRAVPESYKPTFDLEEAIERRDERAVAYWAKKEQYRPNIHFLHNITPRMLAAKTGNIPILEAVLNTKWSSTDKDDMGLTPLHWAVQYNHKEAVKLLLNAGYEIDATDNREYTPLTYAIINKNTDMVDFLIKNGADVNKADSEGTTPLMRAATWCYAPQTSILELLLKAGSKTGLQNKWGQSALSLASEEYCHECIKLLLKSGEDVNNHYEQIPLLVAAQYCDEGTVNILIEAGADVSVTTEDKETPFIVAAKHGCIADEDIIRIFVDSGLDILAKDRHGTTAWDIISTKETNITDKAKTLLKQEIEKAQQLKNDTMQGK